MSNYEVSPSSRRAWIEIPKMVDNGVEQLVALLAEGVDRNVWDNMVFDKDNWSPSSRRAWIEM